MKWLSRFLVRIVCCGGLLCLCPIEAFTRVTVSYSDTCLQFFSENKEVVLSLNPSTCIRGLWFRQKIKMRYGSFEFNERCKKYYNKIANLQLLEYEGSYFLTGDIICGSSLLPFEIGFYFNDSSSLAYNIYVKVTDTAHRLAAVQFEINCPAQHFYGFGEQFSHFDFAGKRIRTVTEENGIGRGDMPLSRLTKIFGVKGRETSTYFPLPVFFTERGQMFKTVPSDVTFDFTRTGKIVFETDARQAGYKFLLNVIADTTAVLSQPVYQALPEWAYGTIMGLQGGAKRVEQFVREAIAAGNPVKAVWIQDWVGRRKVRFGSRLWWTWVPDTVRYPDIRQFVRSLDELGVKTLGYINPFIVKESPWFAEAEEKNYLVKNHINKNYKVKAGGFDAYLIDLANADACRWFKNIIRTQLIDNGFSGWMADFGEWLPYDAKLSGGFSGREFHNFYPVAWARINREAVQEAGLEGRVLVFHRSGQEGSQRYVQALWAGDQTTDFGYHDGLPSAVRAVLTSAACGILYNHSDIGGYTNVDAGILHIYRNRELLYRWIEFAAFTPIFRTHEGLKPEKNIQVYTDSNAAGFFARFGRIHHRLKDYLIANTPNLGGHTVPLIRPLYLHNGMEQFALQYLLGNDLLVAPVTELGKRNIAVRFPEGEWLYAWDSNSRIYRDGETVTIDAPLGMPAVFIRRQSKWQAYLQEIFMQESK
ncbi:MAG: alpha-glucosidase [Chitinophagales bacterium]|nr:alpha-glucosidase [Chitinophagales bacterium]MDW8418303.1 alpha-glucosidase [Chitinophagales bacterium]